MFILEEQHGKNAKYIYFHELIHLYLWQTLYEDKETKFFASWFQVSAHNCKVVAHNFMFQK